MSSPDALVAEMRAKLAQLMRELGTSNPHPHEVLEKSERVLRLAAQLYAMLKERTEKS